MASLPRGLAYVSFYYVSIRMSKRIIQRTALFPRRCRGQGFTLGNPRVWFKLRRQRGHMCPTRRNLEAAPPAIAAFVFAHILALSTCAFRV